MILTVTNYLLLMIVALSYIFRLNFASQSPRPHIVIIVADDLGWNDVSFHGSSQIPTPNIDRLAREGITLNNYYVQPICTPTRAALLTGRYPIHTGMQHSVLVGSQPYGLPLSEKLLPQYLKELGYTNHMVGKWHLGFFKKEYLPTRRGFDSHFGYWLGCQDYYDHTSEAHKDAWGHDFHKDLQPLLNYTGQYSTDLYTKEAVKIISQHNASEPLFLYLPHQAVHSGNPDGDPLQAPQHYINRFQHIHNVKRKVFAGMVSALDDSVGHVVSALAARNMTNSIILFTTDNGGPANGFDYNAASNWPLRGVKATYWEGGLRGVGFIHSPLLKNSHYISNNMIHVTDWLPTLVTAAGGTVQGRKDLDGFNVWHMLSEKSSNVRSEILHNIDPYYRDNAALRMGDYKLVMGKQSYPQWNKWYPPWQDNLVDMLYDPHPRKNQNSSTEVIDVMANDVNGDSKTSTIHTGTRLTFHPASELSKLTVSCGPKPLNASINCQPQRFPCLFHIPSDPCEYHNIAAGHKSQVFDMIARLKVYLQSMVPPGNKPADPAGNPKKHKGYWVPWRSS